MAEEHIKEEQEKELETKAFDVWLARYPHMIINTTGAKKPPLKYQSFEAFLRGIKKPEIKSKRTEEEIIDFAERASQLMKKKRGE